MNKFQTLLERAKCWKKYLIRQVSSSKKYKFIISTRINENYWYVAFEQLSLWVNIYFLKNTNIQKKLAVKFF